TPVVDPGQPAVQRKKKTLKEIFGF
ncbi:Hypothetical protein NocV09_01001610, partial [Nannochloropsis oceanica]